jgi:hypothetical protein
LGAYSLQKTCQSAHPPQRISENSNQEHHGLIRRSTRTCEIIDIIQVSIICIIQIRSIIVISDIIICFIFGTSVREKKRTYAPGYAPGYALGHRCGLCPGLCPGSNKTDIISIMNKIDIRGIIHIMLITLSAWVSF